MDTLRAIACNYLVSTPIVSKGAKAFVLRDNPGNGNDRIVVLARSRSGRWVEKYEDSRLLGHFRAVTIVPQQAYYGRLRAASVYGDDHARLIDQMNARDFPDAERPLGPNSRARA